MSAEQFGIKITIPDKPLAEQIRMIEDMRKVMKTFAEMAGEPIDDAPFDAAIAQAKAEASGLSGEHKTSQQASPGPSLPEGEE